MAMEKGLYQAPLGMEEQIIDEAPLEIEIEDPEAVRIGIDGKPLLEIEETEETDDFSKNLVEDISDNQLQLLASQLIGDFDNDVGSRKDWMQTYVDGLELLGMKIEDRAEPWEGACGVYHHY